MTVAARTAADAPTAGVERRHYPCLEGLRAIAALAVFVHHLGFWTGATFSSPVGAIVARLDVGVPIFFAISGFLLFRSPAAALLDGTTSDAMAEPQRFWKKRFWRIYPAYWLVLTVVLLAPRLSAKPPAADLPVHYLLLQIYPTDKFFEGVSQSWSLAVEMSFYLLLPMFARALVPLMARRSTSQRAVRLLGVLGALFLASVAFRSAVLLGTEGDAFRMIFWLPGTIDYFVIGMAIAVLAVWSDRRPIGQRAVDALSGPAWPWWTLAAAALFIAATGLDLDRGLDRGAWHLELFRQLCYDMVALGVLVPAVFGSGGPVRSILRSRPLAWFGSISYSFYLWHLAVIEWFFRITDRQQFLNWGSLSVLSVEIFTIVASTLVITTALSAATYYGVERPISNWSRK